MVEVLGRNGFVYDARHLSENFYVAGKFIVKVELDENIQMLRVIETVTRATRAAIEQYS